MDHFEDEKCPLIKSIFDNMQMLLNLMNYIGIPLSENPSLIKQLAIYYLFMSSLILLNVLNISMYLFSIFVTNHEAFDQLIPKSYTTMRRLFDFYKNLRIILIVYEVFLILIALGSMLMISLSVLYYLDF